MSQINNIEDIYKIIDTGEPITIISKNMYHNSSVSKLYFNLYHNSKYFNKISISKGIIIDHTSRLMVRGKGDDKEDMKQILFEAKPSPYGFEDWAMRLYSSGSSSKRLNSA